MVHGQLITMLFDEFCPLLRRVSSVESAPRNRRTHHKTELFASLSKHLGWQESHLEIELDAQPLAEMGEIVEALAVSGSEEEGNNVSFHVHGPGGSYRR